jgi:hypothetical protein
LERSRRGSVGTYGLELLAGVVACVCLAGFVWMQFRPMEELTFVDRPRDEAMTPDFVVRYFDATKTPYRLDQGFIRLKIHDKTDVQLRGLLSSLGTYIDLLQEDRQAIVARRDSGDGNLGEVQRRSAEPTEDGRLAITSHQIPWNDQAWQELDQLIQSLESQYREVAEALRRVDPNVVAPVRYTPVEPEPMVRSAPNQTLPRVGQTRTTALRAPSAHPNPAGANSPERIEIIDDAPSLEAGRRLGN